MKLISVNCPNCGSTIDIDPDKLVKYCANCGSKIMLDIDTIQSILIEREKTKQESIKADEKKRIAELEALSKISKEKHDRMILIIGMVGVIACMIFSLLLVIITKIK